MPRSLGAFIDAPTVFEAEQITSFLVAFYRLNPRHVATYVFPLCLESGLPEYVFLALRAMDILSSEGEILTLFSGFLLLVLTFVYSPCILLLLSVEPWWT